MVSIDPRVLFTTKQAVRGDHQSFFVGREKLLVKSLEAFSVGGSALVLFGDPGVGKTSLAWQVMEILAGNTALLDRLAIRTAFPIGPYKCVWLQCNSAMRDIYDVLLSLIKGDTAEPRLPSLFPKVYGKDFQAKLEAVDKINKRFEQVVPSGRTQPAAARMLQVRELFDLAVDRIRHEYGVNELLVFLDEFDRVPDPLGMGELIKTSDQCRFAIIGVADNIGRIVRDHNSAERKLQGSTFQVPGMEPRELRAIFERAESLCSGQIKFSDDYLKQVINSCEGMPWCAQLIGFHTVTERIRPIDATPPFVFGPADFDKALEVILDNLQDSPAVDENSYRPERLVQAVGTSEISEAILLEIARSAAGAPDEETVRDKVNVSKKSFKTNLKPLLEHNVIIRTIELRGPTLKFSTPMLRLYVKLASRKGGGPLRKRDR